MTALAASADVKARTLQGLSVPVKNTTTTFAGGLVVVDSTGFLKPNAGAAGEKIMGRAISQGSVLGATATLVEHNVDADDYVLEGVPVAGASTQAHVMSVVYQTISSDNIKTDLTLTRPTRGCPVGLIVRFKSATSFDVLMFGLKTIAALQGSGTREIVEFGTFANAALITGNIVTGQVMPFRGKFISLFGLVQTAFTGASGTATVNLEIDTVDVTGGTLVVSTAAGGTIGTILAAAAITALNDFYEGSVVDVEVSATGGTQTAGSVRIYAVVERLPGT